MPPIRLEISVVENRYDLVDTARNAWDAFGAAIQHPLILTGVDYGVVDHGCNGEAFSKPFFRVGLLPDWSQFLLSVQLLTTSTEIDRNLTLLHECIHMDFAFGDHRARWERLQAEVRAVEHQLQMMMIQDMNLMKYLWYRHNTACVIRQLPDEIVAEKRMKRDYHELWLAREEYYVRMRHRHEAEIVAGQPNDNLWPFSVFYELLRIQLFIPLAETPVVHAELRRLEAVTDTQLRVITSQETLDFLLRERAALLDVGLDQPLINAEAAYDRVFGWIMATQQNDKSTLRPALRFGRDPAT